MQIPWLFPDFFPIFIFSLTFNKIPWLFRDFCQVWNFPDFSLTPGHPEIDVTQKASSKESAIEAGLCYTVSLKGTGTKMRQVDDSKTISTGRELRLEKNVRSILKSTVCIRNYGPSCTSCKSESHTGSSHRKSRTRYPVQWLN